MVAGPTPGAVIGYRVFCALASFFFVAGAGVFAFSFYVGSEHTGEDIAILAVLMLLTLPFAAVYGAGVFIPRRPWGWTAGIALIILGMVTVCIAPIAIPLLIFWLRPDVQNWFGRLDAPTPGATSVFD